MQEEACKIVNSIDKEDRENFFSLYFSRQLVDIKLYFQLAAKAKMKVFLTQLIVNLWNFLALDAVNAGILP